MLKNESLQITKDMVLFFDMDGTIVDTDLANFYAYRTAINVVIKSKPEIMFERVVLLKM